MKTFRNFESKGAFVQPETADRILQVDKAGPLLLCVSSWEKDSIRCTFEVNFVADGTSPTVEATAGFIPSFVDLAASQTERAELRTAAGATSSGYALVNDVEALPAVLQESLKKARESVVVSAAPPNASAETITEAESRQDPPTGLPSPLILSGGLVLALLLVIAAVMRRRKE